MDTKISENETDFKMVMNKIYKKTGIDCKQYKDNYLKRRINVRIRALNAKSYRNYIKILDSNPNEYDLLLDKLTINVTQFFRDKTTFDAVRNTVLPALISNKKKGDRKLMRIWSAGCASGEEPYSIAMLLHEALGSDINNFMISIYATDIDDVVMAKAKKGVYEAAALKGVEKKIINKYFTYDDDGRYHVTSKVKRLVRFKHLDLISGKNFSHIDMIFCRNVVIYFSKDLQKQLYNKFYDAANRGGYFVMGKTETLVGDARDKFRSVNSIERIYQKP